MTYFIVELSILAMLVLAGFGFAAVRRLVTTESPIQEINYQLADRILKLEEIEAIKEYAEIFGLSNDAFDIDRHQLLELGRKARGIVGEERFEEISKLVKSGEPIYIYVNESDTKGTHHRLNKILVQCELITAPSYIAMNEIGGGDRGGEEATSTRIAA